MKPTTSTSKMTDEPDDSMNNYFDPENDSTLSKSDIDFIPYNTLYESEDECEKPGFWIPGYPVSVRIANSEAPNTSGDHGSNPYVYILELEHGLSKWQVHKRFKDFKILFNSLEDRGGVEKVATTLKKMQRHFEDVVNSFPADSVDKQGELLADNKRSNVISKGPEISQMSLADARKQDLSASMNAEYISPPIKEVTPNQDHKNRLKSSQKVPDEKLEIWLRSILENPETRNHHETAEFFEVSRFSFIKEIGNKYKEGPIKKKPGGGRIYVGMKQFCNRYLLPWTFRWLIIKDTYCFYMNPKNGRVRTVLLFDESFKLNPEKLMSSITNEKEFIIANLQHVLYLKCKHEEEAKYWKESIERVITAPPGKLWISPNRYQSSFPVRQESHCQWFVDAEGYWEKAASMMELAQEEIFIADWWLCPEVYMKRPMAEGNKWRLDQVLKRQAERGVRIFVLLFKEVEFALTIQSMYAKRILEGLHPNIKVVRHPDHYLNTGIFMWAHHEKILIIDQLVAFVGGIDLCYGRWDSHKHALTDLGSMQVSQRPTDEDGNGLAAATATIADENSHKKRKPTNLIQRFLHDHVEDAKNKNKKSLLSKVEGIFTKSEKDKSDAAKDPKDKSAMDYFVEEDGENDAALVDFPFPTAKPNVSSLEITTTSVENRSSSSSSSSDSEVYDPVKRQKRLNRYRSTSSDSSRKSSTSTKMPDVVENMTEEYTTNFEKQQDSKVEINELYGGTKFFPGKDYVNYIHRDFVEVHAPLDDFTDRYQIPRMPWHDIHCVTYGEAARDVARHFIQRWNATNSEKMKEKKDYPYLLPKTYAGIEVPEVFLTEDTCNTEIQVVRSICSWSSLVDKTETSIQQAYVTLIANSKHYIYIENQFFISMINSVDMTNEICKAICERIVKAHRANETFRLFVLIPLLPGFEGDLKNKKYSAMLAVLHFTYATMTRGPHSLVECLKKAGVEDPWKYITFNSLRTHDVLCGKLVTEMIYIHSKLLIVDDLHVIIGSANINDRSQAGTRDSEVCLVVTDKEFVDSTMNGTTYKAGKFASSLRKRLMREHLGLLKDDDLNPGGSKRRDINVEDPVSDAFFVDVWSKIAEENTRLYDEVFKVIPSDFVKDYDELQGRAELVPMAMTDLPGSNDRLSKVVGTLVQFPTQFLENEDLASGFTSNKWFLPMFT